MTRSPESRPPRSPSALGFGETRCFTADEAADAAGVPRGRARRYWRALGYSTAEEGAVDFSASDADLVRNWTGIPNSGSPLRDRRTSAGSAR
ncbi:hypothetical protein ACW9HQ_18670 [Nocardia gipuzkoensis]